MTTWCCVYGSFVTQEKCSVCLITSFNTDRKKQARKLKMPGAQKCPNASTYRWGDDGIFFSVTGQKKDFAISGRKKTPTHTVENSSWRGKQLSQNSVGVGSSCLEEKQNTVRPSARLLFYFKQRKECNMQCLMMHSVWILVGLDSPLCAGACTTIAEVIIRHYKHAQRIQHSTITNDRMCCVCNFLSRVKL